MIDEPNVNQKTVPTPLTPYDKVKIKALLTRVYGTLKTLLFTFIVLAILILSIKGWSMLERSGGITTHNVTDSRSCLVKFSGDNKLTGTRSYSYQYTELFGWRWYDKNTVSTETRLTIAGEPVTIVGIGGKEPWSVNISMGEQYRQLLKPAEEYVILYGDKKLTTVIKSSDMCK